MNNTLSQLCAEFEKMENTIAFQQKIISALPKQPTAPCGCPIMVSSPMDNYPKLKLTDCSWAEIAMYAQSGMADRVFAVGDTKEVKLTDGSTINVRIIGFNHDLNDMGQVIPITFESVETLNEDAQMNDEWTNKGGWADSKLRSSLNNHFFDRMLPEDLRAVIKPCAKLTGTGGKSPKMGNTVDKLFLLSEQEVFGRKIYSIGGEGHWYDYYKQENVGYGKCKQNGEMDWRWERSPYGGTTTSFCSVNSNGGASNYGASYSDGVSFGFCV
jgi:hypothetical protein